MKPKWRFDTEDYDGPRLVCEMRWLPDDHAFGELTVDVTAITSASKATKVQFYSNVVLHGLHPHLGEDGYLPSGQVAVKAAIGQARDVLVLINNQLRDVPSPPRALLKKLAAATIRYERAARAAQRRRRVGRSKRGRRR